MEEDKTTFSLVDEYILKFNPEVQEILKRLRKVIKEAEEKISYGMPTFVLHGNLVYFAAFKNHIGLYPTPSGIYEFKEELAAYKTGKGSIQFPIDKPMPYELISRIVKARVNEKVKKTEGKMGKKK